MPRSSFYCGPINSLVILFHILFNNHLVGNHYHNKESLMLAHVMTLSIHALWHVRIHKHVIGPKIESQKAGKASSMSRTLS